MLQYIVGQIENLKKSNYTYPLAQSGRALPTKNYMAKVSSSNLERVTNQNRG